MDGVHCAFVGRVGQDAELEEAFGSIERVA